MQTTFDRKLNEIRRGVYTFTEVGDVETKKKMASILVKEYEENKITDEALKSLIDHYVAQIKLFKRITIEDVPESVRSLVSEKL